MRAGGRFWRFLLRRGPGRPRGGRGHEEEAGRGKRCPPIPSLVCGREHRTRGIVDESGSHHSLCHSETRSECRSIITTPPRNAGSCAPKKNFWGVGHRRPAAAGERGFFLSRNILSTTMKPILTKVKPCGNTLAAVSFCPASEFARPKWRDSRSAGCEIQRLAARLRLVT
jgi:hypothetical protein